MTTRSSKNAYSILNTLTTTSQQNDHRPEADDESPLIPKAEVTEAVRSLRAGKSPGMDKVPSELMIKRMNPVSGQPLSKKGNLKLYDNYCTICLQERKLDLGL
ncbi:hypothetical protein DPMN_033155 [Dreissena polymorpha]|uniref:Uncharacterized protein n=1 Tax=Dreissena polymorpha TaxID=45954 RepID=A0A9D4M351_DREPO|nr:hypothetical protein DPMN_033155 [Dreissena polymorpha]